MIIKREKENEKWIIQKKGIGSDILSLTVE